jgi:hypothetical protein
MKPACAALLLVLFACTGCIGLDTTKSDAKPPHADSKEVSQRPDSVRPVNPDEITPGNARQAVSALWQELDRAEEP